MRLFSLVFALLVSTLACAEDAMIARLFANDGVEGTMVVASLRGKQRIVHNDARAAQRFSPASTFKIFNSLIGLEEKAVSGTDEIFKWDGAQRTYPAWNRDQTLETAFKTSCVWCYQEIARRVGVAPYRRDISLAHYGELPHDFDLTNFWLDGALRISALEQIAFLEKLHRRELPFSPRSFDILQEIMLAERTDAYRLFAKTGWAARTTPQVGWYVGYVETADDTWLFATNIVVRSEADLEKRARLTKAALAAKGIIR
jgi:beta-lactamase class D